MPISSSVSCEYSILISQWHGFPNNNRYYFFPLFINSIIVHLKYFPISGPCHHQRQSSPCGKAAMPIPKCALRHSEFLLLPFLVSVSAGFSCRTLFSSSLEYQENHTSEWKPAVQRQWPFVLQREGIHNLWLLLSVENWILIHICVCVSYHIYHMFHMIYIYTYDTSYDR